MCHVWRHLWLVSLPYQLSWCTSVQQLTCHAHWKHTRGKHKHKIFQYLAFSWYSSHWSLLRSTTHTNNIFRTAELNYAFREPLPIATDAVSVVSIYLTYFTHFCACKIHYSVLAAPHTTIFLIYPQITVTLSVRIQTISFPTVLNAHDYLPDSVIMTV